MVSLSKIEVEIRWTTERKQRGERLEKQRARNSISGTGVTPLTLASSDGGLSFARLLLRIVGRGAQDKRERSGRAVSQPFDKKTVNESAPNEDSTARTSQFAWERQANP